MNFRQKLRKLRKNKGLTQQQLAEKLSYKTNSYSDVEIHILKGKTKEGR
jgi:transcriptional regulator with XRE-family HTH domain